MENNEEVLTIEAKENEAPYILGKDLKPEGIDTSKGMQILLPNMDEAIKVFHLQQITNPDGFDNNDSGRTTQDGIFSTEIFGEFGSKERRQVSAYLELGDRFMHPFVQYVMRRLSGGAKLESLIMGKIYAIVTPKGVLEYYDEWEEVPEKLRKTGGTGANFLYDFFDKIDWKDMFRSSTSIFAKHRARLFTYYTRDHLFTDKWMVSPPGFRDAIDSSGMQKSDINGWLIRLLRNSNILQNSDTGMAGFADCPYQVSAAHLDTIRILNEMNDFVVTKIFGTRGQLRKVATGKTTLHSARLVLSNQKAGTERPEEMLVTFSKAGVPLNSILACMLPLIQYEVHRFLENYMAGHTYIKVYDSKTKKMVSEEVYGATGEDLIPALDLEEVIINYDKDMHFRLDDVSIRLANGTNTEKIWLYDTEENGVRILRFVDDYPENIAELVQAKKVRPLRWIELLHMAACNAIHPPHGTTRHMIITRYPIDDHNSTFTVVPVPVSYTRTSKCVVELPMGAKKYDFFPIVNEKDKKNPKPFYSEALTFNPLYLAAIGGDFDGDQCSLRILFTEEANKEAAESITSLNNVLGVDMGVVRNETGTMIHSYYNLTYEDNKVFIELKE